MLNIINLILSLCLYLFFVLLSLSCYRESQSLAWRIEMKWRFSPLAWLMLPLIIHMEALTASNSSAMGKTCEENHTNTQIIYTKYSKLWKSCEWSIKSATESCNIYNSNLFSSSKIKHDKWYSYFKMIYDDIL